MGRPRTRLLLKSSVVPALTGKRGRGQAGSPPIVAAHEAIEAVGYVLGSWTISSEASAPWLPRGCGRSRAKEHTVPIGTYRDSASKAFRHVTVRGKG